MPAPTGSTSAEDRVSIARDIERLASERWGADRPTVLIGCHPRFEAALVRLVRFAGSESPILIKGETGTGKELFARGLFLHSPRARRPFLRVNCAQYAGDQLVASQLFGHVRGSFTGAVTDHEGVFEAADGGTVFLDEIGELPLRAQAMLLRVIGEGEVVAVGGTRPRQVDVRVVAATSRDLAKMVEQGDFRRDLYFRLRCLAVPVPALRERGDDWRLIASHFLRDLSARHTTPKAFSPSALKLLSTHTWPGNVREVRSTVETGYHVTDDVKIRAEHLIDALETAARDGEMGRIPFDEPRDVAARLSGGEVDFWEAVHRPFMARDLNRAQVRAIIGEGLVLSGGSYKRLVSLFGMDEGEYGKFMDFLRHQKLKPYSRAHSAAV